MKNLVNAAFSILLISGMLVVSGCSHWRDGKRLDSSADAMYRSDLLHSGTYETKPLHELDGIKWKFKTGWSVFSSPAVATGMVFFGSYDGYLYALDANNGRLRWKFKTQYLIFSSPAIVNGMIYFGSEDGHVYALQ